MLRACCRPCRWSLLLAAIFYLQPRAMSYFGLNLLLNLAVPIALATIAQMFVITVNDLDLSHRRLCRLRRLRRGDLAERAAAARASPCCSPASPSMPPWAR